MLNDKKSTTVIIDSGIGGISVLRKLLERDNGGNYIYFADNRYMPYGKKSKSFLKKRLCFLIEMFTNKYNAEKIIIACNTASSLINNDDFNNVIKMDFDKTKTYFATELTKKNLKDLNVIADKTLANLIEKNINNNKKIDTVIKRHVLKNDLNKLDSFVLGCTHYELVIDVFKKYCPKTKVISNVERLIEKITPSNNQETNIVFLQSKQFKSYIKKLNELVRK